MKRKPCVKDEKDNIEMTEQNLQICLNNQEESYQNRELNQSLHLQYYGFLKIQNLASFVNLHSLFLNNNTIQRIAGLQVLTQLTTLNLSYNRITKIQGINHLTLLYTLDLANNLIDQINEAEVQGLSSIHTLKLGHNKLKSLTSIKGLTQLKQTLTYLDLNKNEEFDFAQEFYAQFLSHMRLISVIGLQNTLFSKKAPSYRKQMIIACKTLVFLDERPVSEDQRVLAQAWKQGGLILQKEVRAKIRQKTLQKSFKIYEEMQERNRTVQIKRRVVLDKLTSRERLALQQLLYLKQSEDFSLLQNQKQKAILLQVEDYQTFIELIESNMASVDLQKELLNGKIELPKMIIDKETPEAIFVYNVSEEQIPLIKQKYYPEETRPVIAVNYEKTLESRWAKEYDNLLHDCYEQLRGDCQLLVPTFNLSLYQYDSSVNRKIKRFELQQLKEELTRMRKEEEQRQRSIEALYQLD